MGLKFSIICGLFELMLLTLFGVLVKYGERALPPSQRESRPDVNKSAKVHVHADPDNDVPIFYPFFQDVNVIVFMGVGFLMTFLKKYGYSGVGYNFFIAALLSQWGAIINGCFNQIYINGKDHIEIGIRNLISAEFAAVTVLISFGVVLGKVSRLQLLVIGILEIVFYGVNNLIAVKYLKYSDVGGSVVIHIFAAYFGLALSWVMYDENVLDNHNEGSSYHSDLSAMIGTVFLWLLWPSFNAALLPPDCVAQHRAIINTYFSLTASCVTVFALSPIFQRSGGKWKLSMVHVQNATLAGGVAVGTTSDMFLTPFGALLIGCIAGALSTVGCSYLTSFFAKSLKIHDTCGVHNLHGIPGIFGGIAGSVVTALAEVDSYGYEGLFSVWSARAPKMNSTEYWELKNMGVKFNVGDQRTASVQAGYQVAGILVTIVVSIFGGIVTGSIVKRKIFDPPSEEQLFNDEDFWELPQKHVEGYENID
ncbi:ammonium transporter Rh type A-like [Stylophora pistillata]|uniref:Ammonium transporter Rh type C n=1 Tax=Stylophora pistillata TaxID=50429 RepID=A0A2B4S1S2_STYPI|nr:ammonium transporter Rh type A-like [Stylophora pistillata]PFX22508.1 Ammonium transporter Rh type C [Stylophora pistillata]